MKINKIVVLFVCIFICLSAGIAVAKEEVESKPTADFSVAFLSQYIWRGYALSENSLVIQPSGTISYYGFSINLWGNLDTHIDDGTGNETSMFNETDFTVAYDHSFGPVSLGVGYIYYGLEGVPDSQEVYIIAGYDMLLSPSITVYRKISNYPSWYVNFSLSHSFELPKGINLNLGASAGYYGYDDVYEAGSDSHKYHNFHDGVISASLDIPLGKYFTMSPLIAYSFPLSDDARDFIPTMSIADVANDNDADFFYGGVTFSTSF